MKILRLIAAYIDNMVIAFICVPLFYFCIKNRSMLSILLLAATYIALTIFKDIPPLSIGKRLLGFDIYVLGSEERASTKQRVCRNVTLLIWPVEVIAMFISPEHRRLSDRFCGTIVKRNRGSTKHFY